MIEYAKITEQHQQINTHTERIWEKLYTSKKEKHEFDFLIFNDDIAL